MTVLQLTPDLPPVYGPLNLVPNGARYATEASFPGNTSLEPYEDRLAVVIHLVNYTNVGGSARSFFLNHLVPPGDKPVSPGSPRLYGTCYHAIISGDGSIVVALDETAAPNSAGNPSNRRFIHVVLMIGDWSTRDARHARTLETLAQFLATCCQGFGLPVEWLNVYHERNVAVRTERALLLTNPARKKVGIVGHSDISAAYTTLTNSGVPAYVERAAPFKNNHGDTLPPDVRPGLLARVRQLIQGDTMYVTINGDLAAFSVRGQIATWIDSPGQRQRLQDDGSLPKTPVAWDAGRLADYYLVGKVPNDVYPSLTKITAAHFAGHLKAA